jgi:hypothetical protein
MRNAIHKTWTLAPSASEGRKKALMAGTTVY